MLFCNGSPGAPQTLVDYLLDVYTGKLDPETLEHEPFQEQLNQAYREARGVQE